MADINLRAQPLNVFGTVGDDMQIVLTVVDSAGDPIDVSGYTISAKVWRGATEVDEMTDAVSGASNNVITLSLTDTETTAIGTERGLRWSLSMTTGGITEQWVGGKFELLNAGHPKASGVSAATLTYTSGDVTVTLGSISTTALDSRYAPIVESIFVPASAGHVSAGSPTASTIAAGAPCYLMDASAEEGVAFTFRVPSDWTTFSIKSVWANAGAGSGAILTRCYTKSYGATEVLTGSTNQGQVTGTAGAQSTEFRVTQVASVTANDETWIAVIQRLGAGGTDTLANDCALLGILVEKVT